MINISPRKTEINALKKMVDLAIQGSKALSDDFPKRLRPIARFFAFPITLLFMLLIFPVLLLKRNRPNSYGNLKTELEARWHSESSIVALESLRDIYKRLLQHFNRVMLGGYKIAPYGKFNFYDYLNVAEMLYHWETQHHNISEAIEICDQILKAGKDSKNMSKTFSSWILKKARAIKLESGDVAAQEYLMKYIDPENDKCRIKEFLHELREAS